MLTRRAKNRKRGHTCLIVNPKSAAYKPLQIKSLTEQLRQTGELYTVCEASSGNELLRLAKYAASGQLAELGSDALKRGPVTTLVAAGGDGTVNLVARAAVDADIPLAILPIGKMNNIARSIYGDASIDQIGKKIITGDQRKIDCGLAGDQPFFSAIGIGFLPALHKTIQSKGVPRFGLGWGKIAESAAAEVKATPVTLKIDAFRFDCSPLMITIALLPVAASLPISPTSVGDDARFELIFDYEGSSKLLTQFVKQVAKREYLFGSSIRLYRGSTLTCQPSKGKQLYLDGEVITIPGQILEVKLGDKQLRVIA